MGRKFYRHVKGCSAAEPSTTYQIRMAQRQRIRYKKVNISVYIQLTSSLHQIEDGESAFFLQRVSRKIRYEVGVHPMLLHAPSCPLFSPGCRSPLLKHTCLLRAQRCTRKQSQSLHDSLQYSASFESSHRQHRAGVQARSSTTDLESEIETAGQEAVVQEAEPYVTHSWKWRDHTINYAVMGMSRAPELA